MTSGDAGDAYKGIGHIVTFNSRSENHVTRCIFLTGATGFLGRALAPALVQRGHRVLALARPASATRLPPGCEPVLGDALEAASFADRVVPADTWVHLVGVSHPAPWKARAFAELDLASVKVALAAARRAGVGHFVYLSVAQPAPMMRAYVAVRAEAERLIRASAVAATFVRPWYVLGPGRRWPRLLSPLYWMFERFAPTRDTAQRLGLLTLRQMTYALVHAVESTPRKVRVLDVPTIRRLASSAHSGRGLQAPVKLSR